MPGYQTKQCNLTGRFIFLIPGIPSIKAIELATNSFYSMNAARQTLETIGFLRGGRIGGFLDGKASFWLTKRQHEVPMIGEDGQLRRVAQWLIELEAPMDLTRLLRIDGEENRLIEGERAAAVLNGLAPAADGSVIDADAASSTTGAAKATEQDENNVPRSLPTPQAELSPAKATPAAAPGATDALGQLFDLLSALQIRARSSSAMPRRSTVSVGTSTPTVIAIGRPRSASPSHPARLKRRRIPFSGTRSGSLCDGSTRSS